MGKYTPARVPLTWKYKYEYSSQKMAQQVWSIKLDCKKTTFLPALPLQFIALFRH